MYEDDDIEIGKPNHHDSPRLPGRDTSAMKKVGDVIKRFAEGRECIIQESKYEIRSIIPLQTY